MIIKHVITSIDSSKGGPSRSSTSLCSAICKQSPNIAIDLITFVCNDPVGLSDKPNNFNVLYAKSTRELIGLVHAECSKPDLVHIHGIWELPLHKVAQSCRRKGVPYIISPRGMLEPWTLQQKRWLKSLALMCYQKFDLLQASSIHVTAESEKKSLAKFGLKERACVIPNGIDLSAFIPKEANDKLEKKEILFLSRIHPKKGIELLLNSFAECPDHVTKNFVLTVVGEGDRAYEKRLRRLAEDLGIDEQVNFLGPRYGQDKIRLFEQATFFVLPTYSENFGIVVAEALASGTPTITTTETPWSEIDERGAGYIVEPTSSALTSALTQLLSLESAQYEEMSHASQLIAENYSIGRVALAMSEHYSRTIDTTKFEV